MIIKKDDIAKIKLDKKTVIFPTDTVYGIGCRYRDLPEIEKLYQLKKRNKDKPMVILIKNIFQSFKYVKFNWRFFILALKYWPGALTLVAKKRKSVPDIINSGLDTIGLRIPKNEIALKLIDRFGPLVVTSLNISGEREVTTFNEAKVFFGDVDFLIEGEALSKKASTVYDTIKKEVLRQGDLVIK